MRRVILAIAGTAVGLVLLLTFKTSTQPAASGSSPAAAEGSPSPAGSGAAGTVTGKAWPTIYGPVQVRVTLSGGRVTAVTATEYPTGTPRDQQINAYAIPDLNTETLKAGDADIDTVSGATYTSQGYRGSLQSALDQAGQASPGASPSSTGTSSGAIR